MIPLPRLLLVSVFMGAQAFGAQAPRPAPKALLVGAGTYSNWGEDLLGPPRDVELMREVLIQSLRFQPEEIQILSTSAGEGQRPTRAAILAQLDRLAESAVAGDLIVILLAGHGARVPDLNGDEVDGLDEAFLPCDTGSPDSRGALPGALLDDELGVKLRAILSRGARVWLIADCCFSGTLDRGGTRGVRGIQSGEPSTRSASRARATEGVPEWVPDVTDLRDDGSLVVFTAARRNERAVERARPDPFGRGAPRHHGQLVYHLALVLLRTGGGTTFAELMGAIELAYLAEGDYEPRPTALGPLDQEILSGGWRPAAWTLHRSGTEFVLSAGWLHGVSPGTVLAAMLPTLPAERFRVSETGPLTSKCEPLSELPSRHLMSVPEREPLEAEVLESPLPEIRLDLALSESGWEPADRAAVRERLERSDFVNWVARPESANWVLEAGEPLRLRQSEGIGRSYWIALENLEPHLERVHRVRRVLAWMQAPGTRGLPDGLEVEFCERLEDGSRVPLPLDRALCPGTRSGVHVRNETGREWRVWTYLLDGNFGITPLPESREGRSVPAGHRQWTTPKGLSVRDDTTGLEGILVLATASEANDLRFFAQAPLEPSAGRPYRIGDSVTSAYAQAAKPTVSGLVASRSAVPPLQELIEGLYDRTRSGPVGSPSELDGHAELILFETRWPDLSLGGAIPTANETGLDAARAVVDAAVEDFLLGLSLGRRASWIERDRVLAIGDGAVQALAVDLPRRAETLADGGSASFRPNLLIANAGVAWIVAYDLDSSSSGDRSGFDRVLVDLDRDGAAEEGYRRLGDAWQQEPETTRDVLRLFDFYAGVEGRAGWSEALRLMRSALEGSR